jgi:hypothetical protein
MQMLKRLTPLQKRYAGFVLWGAVNGLVGAFGLLPMGSSLADFWYWILPLVLVSTTCAAAVFAILIKRSWVLQGVGFLVVGILIPPAVVFGSNLALYRDLRGGDCGDCGLVMLAMLMIFWLIYVILGYISAVVYWALRKTGRI